MSWNSWSSSSESLLATQLFLTFHFPHGESISFHFPRMTDLENLKLITIFPEFCLLWVCEGIEAWPLWLWLWSEKGFGYNCQATKCQEEAMIYCSCCFQYSFIIHCLIKTISLPLPLPPPVSAPHKPPNNPSDSSNRDNRPSKQWLEPVVAGATRRTMTRSNRKITEP